VLDATTAVMSKVAAGAGTTIDYKIGTLRTAFTGTGALGSTAVSAPAGSFTQADVGRVIVATGIPTDTFITAVNDTGTTANLSKAITTALSGAANVVVKSSNAVPVGAYNVVVVSDADPDNAAAASVASSSSTFTVAPF
jgi:hypothetical protein